MPGFNMLLLAEGTMTRIEQEFVRWLLVAGGFFVGFVVTHIVARLLCSFVFKTQASSKLMQLLRIAGGVGAAILVYFLLLPSGGSGPGGAGDLSLSTNKSNKAEEQVKKKEEPKKEILPPEKEPLATRDETVTVTVLGPTPDKKWYLYEDEKEPQTEQAILDRITKRDKSGQKPIKVVQIAIVKNASAPGYCRSDTKGQRSG